LYLAAVVTGKRDPEGWNQSKDPVDFYDAKGVVENILCDLKLPDPLYAADKVESFYHPGKACTIYLGHEEIGSIGELHPDVLDNFAINQALYYFELNFEKLAAYSGSAIKILPPSRFPDTFRDIAMLINDDINAATVISAVNELAINEIEDVAIFDLYKGSNIPAGLKSLAIRIRYRAPDRTLTDDEVNPIHQSVIDYLVSKLNAVIR
jgi:phenylalanyl-tRNA synthetase beta chain